MQSRQAVVLTTLMVAVALMLLYRAAPATELPEGVSLRTLSESPSGIPGIEKIQLQELRMEPGAKWENFVLRDTSLCTVIQGKLTVAWAGEPVTYSLGSTMMIPQGMQQSFYNNGSEPNVQHIWRLVSSTATRSQGAADIVSAFDERFRRFIEDGQ